MGRIQVEVHQYIILYALHLSNSLPQECSLDRLLDGASAPWSHPLRVNIPSAHAPPRRTYLFDPSQRRLPVPRSVSPSSRMCEIMYSIVRSVDAAQITDPRSFSHTLPPQAQSTVVCRRCRACSFDRCMSHSPHTTPLTHSSSSSSSVLSQTLLPIQAFARPPVIHFCVSNCSLAPAQQPLDPAYLPRACLRLGSSIHSPPKPNIIKNTNSQYTPIRTNGQSSRFNPPISPCIRPASARLWKVRR